MNIDRTFATIDVQGSQTCQAAIDARGLSVEVPERLTVQPRS